jgi:protein phosphatase
MAALLGRPHELDQVGLDMVELANARGSKDNVSVIILTGF